MTRKDQSPGPASGTSRDSHGVVGVVFRSLLGLLGPVIPVIVMMAIALIGFAVLFAVLGVTGVVLMVFGLTQGPFKWLGNAVLWTGVIVGFGGAGIVMWKIIRRRPALTTLAGFSEPDDPPGTELPASPSPIVPPRDPMTAERMRALDSRLSAPSAAEPVADASSDGSATRP